MNLIPWKTRDTVRANGSSSGLESFRSEMDRLFERFFDEPFGMLGPTFGGADVAVPVDVRETDDALVVTAEVPGIEPKELEISVTGDVLTLSGTKATERQEERDGWYHAERRYGAFRRSIRLPRFVDTDAVEAEHRNGVVTIRLKKLAEARPRRIPVKARG